MIRSSQGYQLSYRVSGSGDSAVVVLHGGPGGGCDYLSGLHALAGDHRRVLTFDQLGCGASERPSADYPWSIEAAADDVDAMRAHLGVQNVDVIGHSWGGMLALEYALRYPEHIGRLVLWATVASTSRMVSGFIRQLAAVLDDFELAEAVTADAFGDHADPAFRLGVDRWLRAWMTDDVDELLSEILDPDDASRGLWGSRLWFCDGPLRTWNVEPRLGEITAPTLIVHGGHDTSDHTANRALATGIPHADWITLPDESHMIDLDPRGLLFRVLATFLSTPLEKGARP